MANSTSYSTKPQSTEKFKFFNFMEPIDLLKFLLVILLALGVYYGLKDGEEIFGTRGQNNELVNTEDIGTLDGEKIREIFREINDSQPEIFNEVKDDDLDKLYRVLYEKGSLLDIELLTWANQFLNHASPEWYAKIKEIICKAHPELKICGSAKKEETTTPTLRLELEDDIEKLNLPTRVYWALDNYGFKEVGDILFFIEERHRRGDDWREAIKKIRLIGQVYFEKIETALRGAGYGEFLDDPHKGYE